MQWSLTLGPAIAHEAACLHTRRCRAVRIRTMRQQYLHHQVVLRVRFAKCRMQRRLPGVRQRAIHVRAALDQELTQPPVPVKASAVKAQVAPKRLHCRSDTPPLSVSLAGYPAETNSNTKSVRPSTISSSNVLLRDKSLISAPVSCMPYDIARTGRPRLRHTAHPNPQHFPWEESK